MRDICGNLRREGNREKEAGCPEISAGRGPGMNARDDFSIKKVRHGHSFLRKACGE
jgi:hypothetical protein